MRNTRGLAAQLVVALTTVVVISVAGQSEARADLLLGWAVGAKGGMNLSLLSEPAEDRIDLPIPGFVGVSGGGGFAGELMYGDFVGLEVDVLYMKTHGEGSVSVDFQGGGSVDVDQVLESTELHYPVLLKGQLPFGSVRPFIAVGPTFVSQLSSKYEIEQRVDFDVVSDNLDSSYTMWTVALGATVDLPFVRIPIEARGMYRSLSDDPNDRAVFEIDGTRIASMGVKPGWEGMVLIMIGAQYSDGLDL